jgi:hypothetical protein
MRCRPKVLSGVFAVMIGLSLSPAVAGPAHAAAGPPAPSCSMASSTTGFRAVGSYPLSCTLCASVGNAGITNGSWQEYRCTPKLVGLDVWWTLWVRP